ncbi:hypothetical protein TNIN_462241 [Trichonephila inaurata madagascariensis]|uniref:Uncharacterized protein n=1 Tax=Trichonephila inaurata madagascariensis TaxID=2747483 RepID=A0A8X6YU79_9ARAC|nr:hypothetical protein TNIN_462241 [Trichonephila inaurata madagascariensis]
MEEGNQNSYHQISHGFYIILCVSVTEYKNSSALGMFLSIIRNRRKPPAFLLNENRIENYSRITANKDMVDSTSQNFSLASESINTTPPPSPDNQVQQFSRNRYEAHISPPTTKKAKISSKVSPIYRSEDTDSLTSTDYSYSTFDLQKEKILKAWVEHVGNAPQLLNTELFSFDDDTFMEENRYRGDKGKRPMNPKYAYKKKSKSVLNSKLEAFDLTKVGNKTTDNQTLDSIAFQIHSPMSNNQEQIQSADKDETLLSTKFECEKQAPHISDSDLEKKRS